MTKRKRFQVYKEIRRRLISDKEIGRINASGICIHLVLIHNNLECSSDIEDYPELMDQKPKRPRRQDGYWWGRKNPLGTTFRVKALNNILNKK